MQWILQEIIIIFPRHNFLNLTLPFYFLSHQFHSDSGVFVSRTVSVCGRPQDRAFECPPVCFLMSMLIGHRLPLSVGVTFDLLVKNQQNVVKVTGHMR